MKKDKKINSFENKIKESFSKYARIPFLLLLVMILIFVTYEHFILNIVRARLTQNKVKERLEDIEFEIFNFLDSSKDINSNEEFYRNFYEFSTKNNLKGHMIIYDQNDDVKYITQPALEGSIYSKIYNRIFIDRIKEEKNNYAISSVRTPSINNNVNTLIFGKSLKNDKNQEINVIYFLNSNVIRDFIQRQKMNNIIITDENSYVVATTSQIFVNSLNKFVVNNNNDNNGEVEYNIFSRQAANSNFNIKTLTIKKSVFEQYGLLLLFIIMALWVYKKSNQKVANRVGSEAATSINKLVDAVSEMKKGDLKVKVDIQSNDEFEILGDEFNLMSQQLNALINKNQKLLELRKNAQIKQLEAQFNPHFLYNSLETIRYLISFDEKKAQEMILNITKLLRYSIDGNTNIVRFVDDLEYLKIYLEINKIRLDNRFTYNIEVSDYVNSLYMPKLMIQPLIENSIKHGFKNQEKLHINIIGYREEDFIYIKVIDNGSGMSVDTLDKIKYLISNKQVDSKSYGLHSIVQRLNLIYGDKSKLEIKSDESGTIVSLKIPNENILKKESD